MPKKKSELNSKVTIYKVVMPSFMWPGEIILKTSFDRMTADSFIASYPNVFVRPLLKIRTEESMVSSTD